MNYQKNNPHTKQEQEKETGPEVTEAKPDNTDPSGKPVDPHSK